MHSVSYTQTSIAGFCSPGREVASEKRKKKRTRHPKQKFDNISSSTKITQWLVPCPSKSKYTSQKAVKDDHKSHGNKLIKDININSLELIQHCHADEDILKNPNTFNEVDCNEETSDCNVSEGVNITVSEQTKFKISKSTKPSQHLITEISSASADSFEETKSKKHLKKENEQDSCNNKSKCKSTSQYTTSLSSEDGILDEISLKMSEEDKFMDVLMSQVKQDMEASSIYNKPKKSRTKQESLKEHFDKRQYSYRFNSDSRSEENKLTKKDKTSKNKTTITSTRTLFEDIESPNNGAKTFKKKNIISIKDNKSSQNIRAETFTENNKSTNTILKKSITTLPSKDGIWDETSSNICVCTDLIFSQIKQNLNIESSSEIFIEDIKSPQNFGAETSTENNKSRNDVSNKAPSKDAILKKNITTKISKSEKVKKTKDTVEDLQKTSLAAKSSWKHYDFRNSSLIKEMCSKCNDDYVYTKNKEECILTDLKENEFGVDYNEKLMENSHENKYDTKEKAFLRAPSSRIQSRGLFDKNCKFCCSSSNHKSKSKGQKISDYLDAIDNKRSRERSSEDDNKRIKYSKNNTKLICTAENSKTGKTRNCESICVKSSPKAGTSGRGTSNNRTGKTSIRKPRHELTKFKQPCSINIDNTTKVKSDELKKSPSKSTSTKKRSGKLENTCYSKKPSLDVTVVKKGTAKESNNRRKSKLNKSSNSGRFIKGTIPYYIEHNKKMNEVQNNNYPVNTGKKCKFYNKYGIKLLPFAQILQEKENLEKYNQQVKEAFDLIKETKDNKPIDIILNIPEDNKVILGCEHLSIIELDRYFKKFAPYLEKVIGDKEYNWRHNEYNRRNGKNSLTYNTSMVTFTKYQKNHLAELCTEHFKTFHIKTPFQYYFKVLLPELCLRIFMHVHNMEHDNAMKYLEERPVEDIL